MAEPWEPLPGESSKAYAVFCLYRDLGPRRSLEEVSRRYHANPSSDEAARQAGPKRGASGLIRQWAQRWNWGGRAAAWDREVEQRKRQKQLEAIDEMAERHAREALMLQNKAVERLRQLRPEELNALETLRYLIEAAKLERLARGEPTERVAEEHHFPDMKELTDAELAQIIAGGGGTPAPGSQELYRRRLARRSLHEFVHQGWAEVEAAPFVDNWHVGALCEHLEAVTTGQISKLLINVPPGLGKSLLVCVFWPAWEWTLDPSVRWLFASYDLRLSTRDAVRCRALLGTPWYGASSRRRFRLTGDQNQKTYYETDGGGYRLATSIGGHGSGEHPDRIVCDDPHNVQQAESPQERQGARDWWDLTMSTRGVSRQARRVIIMQRLHQDDLSGHVLAEGDWVHVCLPMRFERGRMPVTPLGWTDPRQEQGTLLCPALFGEAAVAQLEKALGVYGAAGQLQQRPVPREGGMFKECYFNLRVKAAPYHARRIRYWDRAATQDGGCYTVGTLLARSDDGNFYVEHVVHGQWEPDLRDEQIVATALRDRRRYGPRYEPVIYIEHEPGSSGVDAYKHTARKLAGFPVRPDRPTGAKEVRAEPWASQCAAKNVYLVEDGTWDIAGWIDEHSLFPLGTLKDRVDSASGGFSKLVKARPAGSARILRVAPARKPRTLRLVVGSREELAGTVLEPSCLWVALTDPPGPGPADPPPSRSPTVLDALVLPFADLDPADLQESWGEVHAGYGCPAEQLLLSRELGKKLWSFLLRRRDPAPSVFVLQDEGDRRALSVAYAIADVLGLRRSEAIYSVSQGEWRARPEDAPPNQYIYEMTKRTRNLVL